MLALTSISAQTKVNKPPNPLSTQSPPFQAHPLCIPFSSPAIPPNQPARTVAFLCHQLREPTRLLSALFHHHPANLQLPPLFILPISPAFVASTNRQRGSTRRIACHFPSFTWTPRPPIVFSFGSPFKSLRASGLQLLNPLQQHHHQTFLLPSINITAQQPWLPRSAESWSSSATVPAARLAC